MNRTTQNPGIGTLLNLYARNFRQTGGQWKNQHLRRSVTALGPTQLTELQVLRITAEAGFQPLERYHSWSGGTIPDFTLNRGELGCVLGEQGQKRWEAVQIEECDEVDLQVRFK